MKTINAEDLKKKIDAKGEFVLIDVLSPESYNGRHVPKAINIPVDQINEKANSKLKDRGKEIIVYCASTECQASPTAAKKLEELGYINVVDFEAGLAGWQDAGFEFEDGSA
jgi:rhodanese-related sulfurtransferase